MYEIAQDLPLRQSSVILTIRAPVGAKKEHLWQVLKSFGVKVSCPLQCIATRIFYRALNLSIWPSGNFYFMGLESGTRILLILHYHRPQTNSGILGEKCSLRQGQSNKVGNFAIYLVRGPNQQTISLLRGNGAENAARSAFASLLCYVMNTMTCNRKW